VTTSNLETVTGLDTAAMEHLRRLAARDYDDRQRMVVRTPLVPDEDLKTDRQFFNLVALSPEELGGSEGFRLLAEELQRLNDQLLVTDLLMFANGRTRYATKGADPRARMRTLKQWAEWERVCGALQRALGTTSATAGGDWVPGTMSSRLNRAIEPELKVAALFRQVDMTSKNYDLPVQGGDVIAYYVPESTSIPATDPITNKVSMVAAKLAARVVASTELDEDSAVLLTDWFTSELGLAIARAIEDAIINGDTNVNSASAQDYDLRSNSVAVSTVTNGTTTLTRATGSWYTDNVKPGDLVTGTGIVAGTAVASIQSATSLTLSQAATDSTTNSRTFARPSLALNRRVIWDGLRKKALISGMPNQDLATFSDANLMAMRKGMLDLGVPPSQIAIIVGPAGLAKIMTTVPATLTGFRRNGELAGPLIPGQVGDWLGSPVVYSDYMREDVNAQGVNDNTANNTFAVILMVNRAGFVLGRRRAVTVDLSRHYMFDTDQINARGTWRGMFAELAPTAAAANKLVAIGRNFS
jgi:hypothetical protein